MRAINLVWIGLVMSVAIALFVLKYEVQSLEDSLAVKREEIVEHQRSIQVLEAEWTFLTDPNRLRSLSAEHLDLAPVIPTRIVDIEAIPFLADHASSVPEVAQ